MKLRGILRTIVITEVVSTFVFSGVKSSGFSGCIGILTIDESYRSQSIQHTVVIHGYTQIFIY